MTENVFSQGADPNKERERLAALRHYEITDTPSEASFDGLVKLATEIFNVPIALLSLVDAERVFFKANVGMGTTKTSTRAHSLCALTIMDENVTVIEDALQEESLSHNPNVIGELGLRFYAGAPLITPEGFSIGAFCILDKKPRQFSPSERSILAGLARTAMDQIELRRSALVKIADVEEVNITLANMQQRLIDLNGEMEAANAQLSKTNLQLNRSNNVTVSLNKNLRKSEQRLKSFINKAPVAFAILTGREMTIEVANNMVLWIWSKTASVIGKPLATAMPELKDQPYLELLDQVFLSGDTYVGDTALVTLKTDGAFNDHYFDFIYEPLKDEDGNTESIIVIANEVTDRIRQKERLEELNQQLQMALEAGELGTFNLEVPTGRNYTSATCRNHFGLSDGEVFEYADFMNSIVPEHRDMVHNEVQAAIFHHIPYQAEYLTQWPDGSRHWISSSGLTRYDAEGKPVNLIGVTVDVTKRKNYEAQKDDFLGIASHELKTPITSLNGTIQMLEMLKDKAADPTVCKLISMAGVSIKKITALVDDLLNMHRISVGQLELQRTTFSAAKMLESCCNNLNLLGKYQLKVGGDLDAVLYADEQRIEQVVVNFINNAIKYAPNSNAIEIKIEHLDEYVKINVRDFGDGIDPAVQQHIFGRYYRANHDGKKYSGLGLGLYIASDIIKRHGGNIGVDSSIGGGSNFWFTIPHAL
ncbi:ATP-binding protein [Sphingobacterium sp. HMA12]|uniref:ATP-binding protein n=1 Tax=Sphingobacterium sp. HMA12 TaxID=2050894 RepID=UPI000CE9D61F|nr:ATP-binding protein [Sphingobacterium sp. HMA12]